MKGHFIDYLTLAVAMLLAIMLLAPTVFFCLFPVWCWVVVWIRRERK